MRLFKDKEEAYNWCMVEGNIVSQEELETERIKANLIIAMEDLESAKDAISKKRFNSAYKIHYDVLHTLIEGLLLFDHVKSRNHQEWLLFEDVINPTISSDALEQRAYDWFGYVE